MTFNSERRLAQTLRSLAGVADDLVVVDSGSNDGTERIARAHGARFFVRQFDDFTRQRQYSVSECLHDWVLTLDSDEVLSEALQHRLIALKSELPGTDIEAFGIRRDWYLLGRRVHCFYPSHCPDQPIRLFRRHRADYIRGRHVHEAMTGFRRSQGIDEPILHFTADSIEDAYGKMSQYSTLAAKDAMAAGQTSNWFKILTLPWLLALKWYLADGGWKDGLVGVVHALYVRDMAYQKWLKVKWDFKDGPRVSAPG
jgi:glycosyltransferase involved in cell wall biosynthesis